MEARVTTPWGTGYPMGYPIQHGVACGVGRGIMLDTELGDIVSQLSRHCCCGGKATICGANIVGKNDHLSSSWVYPVIQG